jgi:transcriptional regulator with XRE-family HTH domain
VNTRLQSAMRAAQLDADAVARGVGVDPRTVQRWLNGRVPHARHRWAAARLLGDDESRLWPSLRRELASGAEATAEVVAAYAHRADIPIGTWATLIESARTRIDLLGYAHLFLPEQHIDLISRIRQACAAGCRVRIMFADPDGPGVRDRDSLEHMNGTLPARIRMAMAYFDGLREVGGVQIHVHDVHLYHAVYRFDDEMIVTPHLMGAHGPQHPALHLRRLGPDGIFAGFADQLDRVWCGTKQIAPPTPVR